MVTFVVKTFERVRARIALLSLKSGRVSLIISFTAPHKMLVMVSRMWTVILNGLGPLNMTYPCCVTLLPTILALRNTWVYICTLYSSDEGSNVEASIDDFLGIRLTLSVPNINPNDGHVGFRRDLNDVRLGCKDNVVKEMVTLENVFDLI